MKWRSEAAGRDLFDLSEALGRRSDLDAEKVVECFVGYMENDGLAVTRAELRGNLERKIEDEVFVGDVPPLLSSRVLFDPVAAFERIEETFISRLPATGSNQ